uniref:Putative secreted peptide n=1 Tax=Anopheles braziliensis TaxID=58242 RepID=A0A2M3ZVP3_9DIPT
MIHLVLALALFQVLDQVLSAILVLHIPERRTLPSSCCIPLHSFLPSDEPYVFLVAYLQEMNQMLVLDVLNLAGVRN